ncbi:MAG: hypothetical protein LBE95_00640 [Holosporaceae bacterium]|jgi:hypothetical protein|nr:hypothetical protein [Holosporaceae bacterium]
MKKSLLSIPLLFISYFQLSVESASKGASILSMDAPLKCVYIQDPQGNRQNVAEFVKILISYAKKNPGPCKLVPHKSNKDALVPQVDLSSIPPIIAAKIGKMPQFEKTPLPSQSSVLRKLMHKEELNEHNKAAKTHKRLYNFAFNTLVKNLSKKIYSRINQTTAAFRDLINVTEQLHGVDALKTSHLKISDSDKIAIALEIFRKHFLEELRLYKLRLYNSEEATHNVNVPIIVRTNDPIEVIDLINQAIKKASAAVSDSDLGDYPKLRESFHLKIERNISDKNS